MQTIDRNNYEEFFLLYVDRELTTEERLAVENFVQQNTDLAVEFEMLMASRFPAEKIEFTDKENLLRTEGNNINETNYEEYFLLYIDNELSAIKLQEVEMYVLQHPKLQEEFISLKQAVLAPEVTSYGDKKELYRTERKRTIYLRPWRMAAAAIFIGVCAIGLWLVQKPGKVNNAVADSHSIQAQHAQKNVITKPADTLKQQTVPQQQIIAEQPSSKKEKKILTETAIVKKKRENTGNKVLDKAANDKQEQIAVEPAVTTHNDIAQQQKEPPPEIYNTGDASDHNTGQKQNVATLQTSTYTQEQTSYAVYPVVYKEINTNDDDRSLHVGMLDLNKDKVKTLFKKAGRIFGNKSNNLTNDDGKLQVANFEIETRKQ
jgi:hypothetical protein